MNTNQIPAPRTEGRHPVRTLPVLSRLAALWSAMVAVLALWWLLDPAAYPLTGHGGVNGLTALLPVMAAVVPGGLVAPVLCASSISMVMLAAQSTWVLLPMIPTPVWGRALAVAVYAYYVRRPARGSGARSPRRRRSGEPGPLPPPRSIARSAVSGRPGAAGRP